MVPLLNVTDLGHWYNNHDWLFRGVNLTVEPGEIVAILGPNARGKTTMLSCCAGLRQPREGKVSSSGPVGFVPQKNESSFAFSVLDIVLLGRARLLKAWSVPRAEDEAVAWKALETVGIEELASRDFSGLSGGQQQLVLIARALTCEPSTLILDEPTSALDVKNQKRVLWVLSKLADDGIGVLFTTHDPTHAFHVADQTVLMGREITVGKTADQLSEESISGLYGTRVRTPKVDFISGQRTVVVPDYAMEDEIKPCSQQCWQGWQAEVK